MVKQGAQSKQFRFLGWVRYNETRVNSAAENSNPRFEYLKVGFVSRAKLLCAPLP